MLFSNKKNKKKIVVPVEEVFDIQRIKDNFSNKYHINIKKNDQLCLSSKSILEGISITFHPKASLREAEELFKHLIAGVTLFKKHTVISDTVYSLKEEGTCIVLATFLEIMIFSLNNLIVCEVTIPKRTDSIMTAYNLEAEILENYTLIKENTIKTEKIYLSDNFQANSSKINNVISNLSSNDIHNFNLKSENSTSTDKDIKEASKIKEFKNIENSGPTFTSSFSSFIGRRFLIFILVIFLAPVFDYCMNTLGVSVISKSQSNIKGTYTVQDGKVILKTLRGDLFAIFYAHPYELREGDKGNFSSFFKAEDKYSFSQTFEIYYPNNNKLAELIVNKANFSNFPPKMLNEILHDKNKMSKILSSPEEMTSFIEKGYFSFESFTMTEFFASGKQNIKMRLSYGYNFSEGFLEFFYEDGNIKQTQELKNQMANGLVKLYYENGNLAKVIEVENDISNGKFEEFYENGKIAVSTTFKNGIQDGICEIYNENGKLINKVYMKDWKVLKR